MLVILTKSIVLLSCKALKPASFDDICNFPTHDEHFEFRPRDADPMLRFWVLRQMREIWKSLVLGGTSLV